MPEDQMVLIVDDDPSVLRALSRLLRSYGVRSRTFSSGPELLADPHHSEADCFVVDVHMPVMNGYELANKLAGTTPGSPIVLISAHVEEVEQWQDKAEMASALLVKPFSGSELMTALAQALGPGHLCVEPS